MKIVEKDRANDFTLDTKSAELEVVGGLGILREIKTSVAV